MVREEGLHPVRWAGDGGLGAGLGRGAVDVVAMGREGGRAPVPTSNPWVGVVLEVHGEVGGRRRARPGSLVAMILGEGATR